MGLVGAERNQFGYLDTETGRAAVWSRMPAFGDCSPSASKKME